MFPEALLNVPSCNSQTDDFGNGERGPLSLPSRELHAERNPDYDKLESLMRIAGLLQVAAVPATAAAVLPYVAVPKRRGAAV